MAASWLPTALEVLSCPTNQETLQMPDLDQDDPAFGIDEMIRNHPYAQHLRMLPQMEESRPHNKIPPQLRGSNLTAGVLMGPDKLVVPPLTFTEPGKHLVQFIYLGQALCGHPGVVHGGMLATMLDEGLARCCFPALPEKIAVTASLKVNYRKPCHANQIVILEAHTTKVEGKKAWVEGKIIALPPAEEWLGGTGQNNDISNIASRGTVLAEAEALFVQPKYVPKLAAAYMSRQA